MSEACITPQSGSGFLAGMLNYVDCQAQTIGETGYQALASPTSSVSLALTALLTVFIAATTIPSRPLGTVFRT